MRKTNNPTTRLGWHQWYAKRFDKTQDPQAAVLAMWYLTLHLAFDEP